MDLEKIGKFIHDLRVEKNFTQRDLADRLYVSHQAVSKWERGVALPDIESLNRISELFDISINDLIAGERNSKGQMALKILEPKNNKKFKIFFIITITIFLIGLFLVGYIITKDKFKVNTISTTCDNFKITGVAVYDSKQSNIYISNIEYCGEEDNTTYEKIESILLEDHDNTITKISSNTTENITLEKFLKDLKINVNNYEYNCNKFNKSDIYLEIKAYKSTEKITAYNIPLEIEENCD
ncbi:MAG: helix-turn-helix transcriptional regulator [Bacilli bacterium]|nr:helix-turn-helix transcriptional regulator [Bacilli bacterium]